ncbi:orotidine-5'-phosphate decarboxylase [Planococcus sp. CP5-4]|uniref:orotidine-5'-phosphate decarboxylase n=1 Tax=unclassified Planococcus (in: firmicutes) TaxID=2662419 RepID=UPI001C2152A6|nr:MULTISPECIES: orotidine-5'-phosphate decarboxylase [unclassified Planococcus (in: firmicutes)]MBU9672130.1 orotidine-5'-phosphate decarboxylase [Planococcus sp. CP5-4_YE]MBV0907693.1 orotidine-5'-phosphate decarboxylase [Planococcus sp. CP5-4_UN]MBW6062860.1 orotidine-5'-phosphate decarboxylase [Planococcus sp. CP5-4]
MTTKPIIALDFPSKLDVEEFLSEFTEPLFLKVGMELFYQEGPELIHTLNHYGHDIFLDLKLHDIPNTVESAMRRIAELGVDMVNVHAAGGLAMMEAAKRGLSGSGTKLIAVTQLTSTSEEQMQQEQLIAVSLEESVLHYAKLAKQAGLDGVVCSVHEAKAIGEACGEEFLRVTPGIRPAASESHDQKRIATPSDAKAQGSTYIVVGRAITRSENPQKSYDYINGEWSGRS